MENFIKTVGDIYCLIALISFIVVLLIIIAYIKTYYHIKRITYTVERIQEQTNVKMDVLVNSAVVSINNKMSALEKQYFYDHCFMNNLGPHQWRQTGTSSNYHFEFRCIQCGQVIYVPKVLQMPIQVKVKDK